MPIKNLRNTTGIANKEQTEPLSIPSRSWRPVE